MISLFGKFSRRIITDFSFSQYHRIYSFHQRVLLRVLLDSKLSVTLIMRFSWGLDHLFTWQEFILQGVFVLFLLKNFPEVEHYFASFQTSKVRNEHLHRWFRMSFFQKLLNSRSHICGELRDWYHLYNSKNVKNIHGGVTLLPGCFSRFFKLYKWYQIAQHTTYLLIRFNNLSYSCEMQQKQNIRKVSFDLNKGFPLFRAPSYFTNTSFFGRKMWKRKFNPLQNGEFQV